MTASVDAVIQNLVTAAIAAAAHIVIGIKVILLRREKLVDGEADPLEKIAGIVRRGRPYALFFGNAEVICGDEKLNITLQLNDSEQAKGNIYPALLIAAENKAVVKYPSDAVGNVAHINYVIVGIFAAALVYVRKLCTQADRVNDLCLCHKG